MATFHKRLTKLGKPPLLISFLWQYVNTDTLTLFLCNVVADFLIRYLANPERCPLSLTLQVHFCHGLLTIDMIDIDVKNIFGIDLADSL